MSFADESNRSGGAMSLAEQFSSFEQAITHLLRQKSDYDASDMKAIGGHWSMRSLGGQVTDEQYLAGSRTE